MTPEELLERLREYGADLDGIQTRFMGDAKLFQRCFLLFMEDENFALLGDALNNKEYQSAFAAAHTLKGVAGNLGLTPIYERICGLVEDLRAQRCGDHLEEAYADILSQWHALQDIA